MSTYNSDKNCKNKLCKNKLLEENEADVEEIFFEDVENNRKAGKLAKILTF